MAVPAYTTDLITMSDAESATGWSEALTWADGRGVGLDPDDYIQNLNCISQQVKSGISSIIYDNGAGVTLNQDDAVLVWAKYDAAATLLSEALGGLRTMQGSGTGAFYGFKQLGGDSYAIGGWRNLATGDRADAEVTEDYTVGTPSTVKQYHGFAIADNGNVPSKGNPMKNDAIRYGRCELRCAGGQAADYANAAGAAAVNDLNTTTFNRWGLFQAIDGGYLWKGLWTLGYVTAVDWRDSAVNITIDDAKHCTKNFNKIEVRQATSRVDWTGYNFVSLGTKSPGRFEMIDAADVNKLNCSFSDMDTFVYLSSASVLTTSWIRCNTVTAGGADLTGSKILEPNITANTSGLVWNVNTDPSGLLDGMTFTKTPALAHHAIEFGLNIPTTTITLNNIDFGIDFSATAGGTVGDETFHFLDTIGTITLNLVGCTGNFGYRTEGVTVTIAASVTVNASGVSRGTPVKLIANEAVGSVAVGDVLSEQFADVSGAVAYSHNDEGDLDIRVVARNQGVAVAAIANDGATFVDETIEASSNVTADMTLLPITPVVGDAYYFGHDEEFNRMKLDISTARVGTLTLTWEYWNGAWVALSGVSDLTTGFSVAGESIVSFTAPGDWVASSVTNQANIGAMFYVRARVSAFTSQSTAPVGRKVTLDVSRYLPYDEIRTIVTGVGLNDIASWTEDKISKFDPND